MLPWYEAGTLDDAEAAAFREHLSSCNSCQEELELIRGLREQLELHGEAFLEDHPSSERLVATVTGQARAEEARNTRRHLALCAACATEARLIGGASASPPAPSGPDRASAGWWPWIAVAAMLFSLAMLIPTRRGPGEPTSDVIRGEFIRPTERGGGSGNVIRWSEGPLVLMFEVDLPRNLFPVTLQIVDDTGAEVLESRGNEFELLSDDLYLVVRVARNDFPPGSYGARLRVESGEEIELQYRFEIRD